MEKFIRNADDLVKWLMSLYKLPKHRATQYNSAGIIVADEVVRELLCSEAQGKITVDGRNISIITTKVGYGCSAVHLNDPDLQDNRPSDKESVNSVDLSYVLSELIEFQMGNRSVKSLSDLLTLVKPKLDIK